MTHSEPLLQAAYRSAGLSMLGISFERAMAIRSIRISLECAATHRARQAVRQQELFDTTRMAHAPAAAGNTSALTGQPANRNAGMCSAVTAG